ncbi:MAG: hypothetical protein M3290_05045 [Actinomycetota bacterium]|nr:hypothetical protein [Actinomycetota bacterium]
MSQQPRRRRRGRGGRRRSGSSQNKNPQQQQQQQQPKPPPQEGSPQPTGQRRRRGRRGRERAADIPKSPESSEDLVRAVATERPAQLTAPPDGQTLEQVIGELQSEWGVPQYPQEYRITLKVADEKDRKPPSARPSGAPADEPAPPLPDDGAPRREKAPGMHRQSTSETAPKRKRGRRRRRRGRGRAGEGPSQGDQSPET